MKNIYMGSTVHNDGKPQDKPCEIDRLPRNSRSFWGHWVYVHEGQEAYQKWLVAEAAMEISKKITGDKQ